MSILIEEVLYSISFTKRICRFEIIYNAFCSFLAKCDADLVFNFSFSKICIHRVGSTLLF